MVNSIKMTQDERYFAMRNVTWWSVVINIGLSLIKIVFGIIGHSQALIADGLHSLSDLISDGVVLITAKYSTLDADANHPYGHARFETLATIVVGGLLLVVAIGIVIQSGQRLLEPGLLWQPTGISLAIVILSILVKEALYQYTQYVAQKLRSKMLEANAWHHRSDAISSIIVLIGIIGSMVGITWLDTIAAIGVSLMIAHIGWSLGWGGVRELVDTGLDENQLRKIKQVITAIAEVRTLHELRTRSMGSQVLVDVHILVNPLISVSEGHQIAETVRAHLIAKIDEITDVLVHIDPEPDETMGPNLNLPLRHEITTYLQRCWQSLDAAKAIESITLHYLTGKLTVDIYLSLTIVQDVAEAQALSQQFAELAKNDSRIQAIRVYFS
jgi:cation diffusion facilitator family transporter